MDGGGTGRLDELFVVRRAKRATRSLIVIVIWPPLLPRFSEVQYWPLGDCSSVSFDTPDFREMERFGQQSEKEEGMSVRRAL